MSKHRSGGTTPLTTTTLRRRLWEAVQQANPITQNEKSAQGDLYWLHNRPRGAHQRGKVDWVRVGLVCSLRATDFGVVSLLPSFVTIRSRKHYAYQ